MLTPRLDFDMIAPSDDSKLQITTGARQNPIMGQHRISSFQVLVRHMTDIYIVQSSLKGAPPLTISEDCSSLTWDLMNGAIHRRTRPKVSKKDLAGSMTTSPMVKCQSKFYALWTHFDKPGTRTGQFWESLHIRMPPKLNVLSDHFLILTFAPVRSTGSWLKMTLWPKSWNGCPSAMGLTLTKRKSNRATEYWSQSFGRKLIKWAYLKTVTARELSATQFLGATALRHLRIRPEWTRLRRISSLMTISLRTTVTSTAYGEKTSPKTARLKPLKSWSAPPILRATQVHGPGYICDCPSSWERAVTQFWWMPSLNWTRRSSRKKSGLRALRCESTSESRIS